jgi:hypothetical protein
MPRLGKLALALLLAATFAVPGSAQIFHKKKKSYPPFALHKNLVVDLQPMPQVVAKQKCGNWAWAASLETALRAQGVPLDQTFWILRLNNGEVCLDSAGTPDDLIRYLERDPHFLGEGKKVQLRVQYVPGPPTAMDAMIRSVQQNRPMIVYWRGRARIISGVTYDENVSTTGDHIFAVQELRMIDLYAAPADPARVSKFVKGTDSLADFDGIMMVQVVPAP